jgi:hypothetical protein
MEHMFVLLGGVAAAGGGVRLLLGWKSRRDTLRLHLIERAALGVTDRELELASKLLQTLHLSVDERRELTSGRLRLSVLVAAARSDLVKRAFLPSRLRPESFDGVLLELRADTYWVHTRYETGVGRYSQPVASPAVDLKDAVLQYLDANGGNQIDGVPIDRKA